MDYTGKDIARWMEMVPEHTEIINEAAKAPHEKNMETIVQNDEKIFRLKLDQLNRRIKRKYYDKNTEIPEEKMYQFDFSDRGDHYEFAMPLNILFGEKTQKFCAEYWNDFFDESDIRVEFTDNIRDALKQAGGISLKMKIDKSFKREIEDNKEEK